MGEPIRILDLARMMIALSGRQVRDAMHPDGEIAIEFGGLRPGEKLVEELQLAGLPEPTEHPRILRIDEPYLRPEEFSVHFEALRTATNNDDPVAIRMELERLVDGYRYAP